jgi:hypothetical protein
MTIYYKHDVLTSILSTMIDSFMVFASIKQCKYEQHLKRVCIPARFDLSCAASNSDHEYDVQHFRASDELVTRLQESYLTKQIRHYTRPHVFLMTRSGEDGVANRHFVALFRMVVRDVLP